MFAKCDSSLHQRGSIAEPDIERLTDKVTEFLPCLFGLDLLVELVACHKGQSDFLRIAGAKDERHDARRNLARLLSQGIYIRQC